METPSKPRKTKNGLEQKLPMVSKLACGLFSVSFIKSHLQRVTFDDLGTGFVWNGWTPLKVNFFVWRLALNRLPTMDNLEKRNVQTGTGLCRLCSEHQETVDHLFVSCRMAQSVWDFIGSWCRLHGLFLFGVNDTINFHKQGQGSVKWRKVVQVVIQTTLWCIRRCRNNAIFKRIQPSVRRVEEVKVLGYLWYKNRSKVASLSWENWCNFDLACMGV
ncbi:putative reverse transcriptase zinc-binding domain-containing protein [Helianthus annuus]|nr:putative reverse transcriptase zinc-binding domain-containing protein [Helianthus annuus]